MHATTLRRTQLCRLLQIVQLLQSGRKPNARQLADACEVSRRTIFRDLDSIEAAGIPIVYDASRQGYQIATEGGPSGSTLGESEVLALAIAIEQLQASDPFGLAETARSALGKLMDALPAASKARLDPILTSLADHETPHAPAVAMVNVRVLEAVTRRVQVRLGIRGAPDEQTRVVPYRIFVGPRGWCLVGYSSLDRCVRAFDLADIEVAILTDDPGQAPPRFRLAAWLAKAKGGHGEGWFAPDPGPTLAGPADFNLMGG